MTTTNIYFHITPEYLPTQAGVIEGAQKAGVKGFYILDIFNKVFCNDANNFTAQMQAYIDLIYRIVYNNNNQKQFPVKEVIISLRSNFWCDMTQQQIDQSTCRFKTEKPADFYETVKYSNRFYPDDISLYHDRLYMTLHYMSTKPKMLEMTTFDLWGEADAKRYWWGTFREFELLTDEKVDMLRYFGCNMLMAHNTSSLLMKVDDFKRPYKKFIANSPYFTEPGIGFSTSLYEYMENGLVFNYGGNKWPSRTFNRSVIAEAGLTVGMKEGSELHQYFQSKLMMHYFVRLLKFARSKGVDTICLFTLCDAIDTDSRGILAYWGHTPHGYTQHPVWFVFLHLLEVIKEGWEITATGIKGVAKEIILTETGYNLNI